MAAGSHFPAGAALYALGGERMPIEDRQAFVAAMARDHGQRLRRFIASRLRYAASDVPDLVQEIYLRLLRIPHEKSIRSPQAYLFTIAFHVLHQHKLTLAETPEAIDPIALDAELETFAETDLGMQWEARERLAQLERVLRGLPRNAYVTFVLHHRYGFTLEEIGEHLGVSRAMVKKHLARAVAHCRMHGDEIRERVHE